MNAAKRLATQSALILCGALAVALTGCQTHVIHSPPQTVYVPTPAPPPAPPVVIVPPPAPAPVLVIQSENDFYEPLGAYGRWVVVGSYGRCWVPARVEAGWRPYSNGYWQRTDAGWYWASEEPWGWATYHYGRWDWHGEFGWIWVPHTQWAPAWVSWREGGGYVGWAPLRPAARMDVRVEVQEPAFASRAFVFVEHRRMLEPVRPKTVIVNNTTIINQTVNLTKVTVVNKTVINEGPRPEVIERESGRKVPAVPAHEFRRREESSVASRQRNIPAVPEKKVQPPVPTERQPAPNQAVRPRNQHVVEPPAEVVPPPPRPPVTQPPVRQAEKRQPVATPARPTPPRPEAGNPARSEKQPATGFERKVTNTPPVAAPKAEVKREVNPPVKIAPVPPPTGKAQAAPQTNGPAAKTATSRREQSRAAARGEALKKQRQEQAEKEKKQDEEQATPTPQPR